MSLVRLLTAGKSLVGIQDSKSRYRSVDPRAMPKFGSEKKINAEVARETEVKVSVATSSAESSKANATVAADRNVRAPVADKNVAPAHADKNVGVTVAGEKTEARVTREDRAGGWMSQLGSKLSSLVSQKPKATKSGIPRFNGVPVQGELSLDNIKVVRNDLSDTDLEVVARKVAPVEKAAVGRASSRAAEESAGFGSSPARGDARPTMFGVAEAVES